MLRTTALALGVASAVALIAQPADAQKSRDSLRLGINDQFSVLDPYHFPQDEAGAIYRTVYETLVAFDERKRRYVPRLAKSWTRIDPKTLEFELRDDVVFHNGDKFDADDVVHTINYLRDPNSRLRFKDRYDWVANVEKLGPYKVRVTSKRAFATDLLTLAYRFFMYDSKLHAKLENKADYGRVSPVTTGPYKVASIDQQRIVLERNDNYYEKSGNFRAPIKQVVGQFLPDRQTQLAKFFTGELDVMRNVPADIAREMASRPNAAVTPTLAGNLMYVTLDAAGRSDSKVMTDQRVRKAFMMAVDRDQLAKTVIPGGTMPGVVLKAICVEANVGCASTTSPPAYDPEGAKKLLAEAGYAGGFDLELNVHAPIKEIGEAIAGQVRKVGIRASVRPLPLALYVRLRGEGKFTAFTGFYPTGAQPDLDNILDFFFSGNRDYWNDPTIKQAMAQGAVEFDAEKRVAIYEKALDRINEQNYILPVGELPIVWVHTKDVRIAENPLSAIENRLGDYLWR
jgi:peptide/nickel transport system substrate-binding protein